MSVLMVGKAETPEQGRDMIFDDPMMPKVNFCSVFPLSLEKQMRRGRLLLGGRIHLVSVVQSTLRMLVEPTRACSSVRMASAL